MIGSVSPRQSISLSRPADEQPGSFGQSPRPSLSPSRPLARCGQLGPAGPLGRLQSSLSSVSLIDVQPGSDGKPLRPSPSESTLSLQTPGEQTVLPGGPRQA